MNLIIQFYILATILINIVPLFECQDGNVFVCRENNILTETESEYYASRSKLNEAIKSRDSIFKPKSLLDCYFKKGHVLIRPQLCSRLLEDTVKVKENNDHVKEFDDSVEAIQSGIQEVIKLLKPSDNKYLPGFIEKESKYINIPMKNKNITFQAFAPENFLNLRKLFGVTEEFNESFTTSKLIKGVKPGYFYTDDRKYAINTISAGEQQFLSLILSEYFIYFCKFPINLLPKFVGLYKIKFNNKEYYLTVRRKIFTLPLQQDKHKQYYVKGKNVLSNDLYSANNQKFCLLEKKFLDDFKNGFKISSNVYTDIQAIIKHDIEFLKQLKVTDYLLILVISTLNKSSQDDTSLQNRRIRITHNDKNLLVHFSFQNILQNGSSQYEYERILRREYCSLKFTRSTKSDSKRYGNELLKFILRYVFKSDGTK